MDLALVEAWFRGQVCGWRLIPRVGTQFGDIGWSDCYARKGSCLERGSVKLWSWPERGSHSLILCMWELMFSAVLVEMASSWTWSSILKDGQEDHTAECVLQESLWGQDEALSSQVQMEFCSWFQDYDNLCDGGSAVPSEEKLYVIILQGRPEQGAKWRKSWQQHYSPHDLWPEYYSVLKRKERLTHAATWITLKDIMLSKVS